MIKTMSKTIEDLEEEIEDLHLQVNTLKTVLWTTLAWIVAGSNSPLGHNEASQLLTMLKDKELE